MQLPTQCRLCPRQCGANRAAGETGRCGAGDTLLVARAALHHWEEPCLSGPPDAATGSGTVFFTGCPLGCCYCQNYAISQQGLGKAIDAARLEEIFLELQAKGARNLNLVTATQWLPWVLPALRGARARGLHIPVVYNTGGYERTETVRALAGYVDIWLADLKYAGAEAGAEFSGAADYNPVALAAIRQMLAQTGAPALTARATCSAGSSCGIWCCPARCRTRLPWCGRWPTCAERPACRFCPALCPSSPLFTTPPGMGWAAV